MKNKKHKISKITGIAAAAGAVIITMGSFGTAPVLAATDAANAYITQAAARAVALNHAKVNASQITGYEIELDKEWNGVFYEIEFNANGYEYDYKINASNATVAKVEKKALKTKPAPDKTWIKPVTVKPNVTYIGYARAKTAVLNHSGLKENQISGFKIETDHDKGTAHYDIEFRANGYEYDYEINAVTGKVMKFEKELDDRYTGLVKFKDGKWYYVKNGRRMNYTGLAKSTDGKYYYAENGIWNKAYTGYARNTDGKWYFVRNGAHDPSYTGLAKNKSNGGWFYAEKGVYKTSYTGIAKSTDNNLYYVKDSAWNKTYTGLAKYTDGKWYYVKNGTHVPSYTGISVSTDGRLYYVKDGKWNQSYTGLAKYSDGKWYYVNKGAHIPAYTGVCYSTDGKLYYAKNGKWDTTFTGKARDAAGKEYNVKNGRVV